MSFLVNSNAQTKTANTFPIPVTSEVSSPNHIDPVMYVKYYTMYQSVPTTSYLGAFRFLKNEDDYFVIMYGSDPRKQDVNNNNGFWAKLKKNPDYMSITNYKHMDERIYVNGEDVVVMNGINIGGGQPPSCKTSSYSFLIKKGIKLETNSLHSLWIPAKNVFYKNRSVSIDTLAQIPEKELSKWLRDQCISGKDQGHFNIQPVSTNSHYEGSFRNINDFLK